jgi:hypothetical protein
VNELRNSVDFLGEPFADSPVNDDRPPLKLEPWLWVDPATLRPDEWLIGRHLVRGQMTVLASPGGAGKTTLAIAMALAFITGREDILGEPVYQTGSAWIITLEDSRDALLMRIAAAMMEYSIKREDILGRLFVNCGRKRRLLVAQATESGNVELCEDAETLGR